MPGTSYHFSSSATVDAPRARVHGLLLDLERYPEWWHQVRAVGSLGPDDALLVCRSLLPYDLEVRVHAVSREPGCLAVDVDGPLAGWVRWALTELGPHRTRLDYEQRVRVRSWPLVAGSWVARPLLRANHAWMMRGAERGIRRRLAPRPATHDRLTGGA
ncbi:MAG TPA: SRPBCC family protein [Marmoricola sp.]|nr:SRPBCC family protein [Marmoricola sp.]